MSRRYRHRTGRTRSEAAEAPPETAEISIARRDLGAEIHAELVQGGSVIMTLGPYGSWRAANAAAVAARRKCEKGAAA